VRRLASNAQKRDRERQRGTRAVESDDILDQLELQGGRCFYSGVPMEYTRTHSHWRMSLERIDNELGYTNNNCVLVAAEFNTSDYSKNKPTHCAWDSSMVTV